MPIEHGPDYVRSFPGQSYEERRAREREHFERAAKRFIAAASLLATALLLVIVILFLIFFLIQFVHARGLS